MSFESPCRLNHHKIKCSWKMKTGLQFLSFKFILLFLLLLSVSSASRLCHPEDKNALLQIKKSFNNPYHLASWDPKTDCCGWYDIQCDAVSNRVVSLTIFAANISGHIPAAVGNLPYLRILEFHKITNLTGAIQPSIAKLNTLVTLRLSWTNLTGPVPGFISHLTRLHILDLSFNSFSGSIPASLALLPNITTLRLDRNRLTGSIPDSFGRFVGHVPGLYLSHNRLSGKIPASLGNMNFHIIDLSRNALEGDASMLFGSIKSTEWIDVSRNRLEFDLSKVTFPRNLYQLDLNHNKIYGSIPAELAAVRNLYNFNLSYNRLCGPIPDGETLQKFDYSAYFHNRCLCGSPLASSCK